MNRRMLAAVLVLAAVLLPVTACGSGDSGLGGAGLTVGVDVNGETILPIDNYAFTTEEVNQRTLAVTLLSGDCMRHRGYPFDAARATAETTASAKTIVMNLGRYGNKRRYGVIDATTASRYGYHLESVVLGLTPKADPHNLHGLGEFGNDAAGTTKLQAFTACQTEATNRVSAIGSLSENPEIAEIGHESFSRSVTDPAVVDVVARWSECMKAKGYEASSPIHITGVTADTPSVSPAEIAEAQADVACKQQYHVVDVWFNSEVTYQNQQIEQHAEVLKQLKQTHDDEMKRVAEIIASGA